MKGRARNLALRARLAQLGRMERDCEVCSNLPRTISPLRPMVDIQLEKRTVVLCQGHARIAAKSGVKDFEGLRALYGTGRRSHVPRRDPHAVVLPDDKGRKSVGRRASDQA